VLYPDENILKPRWRTLDLAISTALTMHSIQRRDLMCWILAL
jgi:hypothetical protein